MNYSDFYKVLNIPQNATREEIKRARNESALKHHSDKGGSEEMMKKINEAFRVLSNSELRQKYDFKKFDEEPIDEQEAAFNSFDDFKNFDIFEKGHKFTAGALPQGRMLSEDFIAKINMWKEFPLFTGSEFCDRHTIATPYAFKKPPSDEHLQLINREVSSINSLLSAIVPQELWGCLFSKVEFVLDKGIINSPLWSKDLPPQEQASTLEVSSMSVMEKMDKQVYMSMCQSAISQKRYDRALKLAKSADEIANPSPGDTHTLSFDDWVAFANMVDVPHAEKFIEEIDTIYKDKLKNVPLKGDRDHLRWKYLDKPNFDQWLDHLIALLKIDSSKGEHCIPYFRAEMQDENFLLHRDNFLAKGDYTKMAICHRLARETFSWEKLAHNQAELCEQLRHWKELPNDLCLLKICDILNRNTANCNLVQETIIAAFKTGEKKSSTKLHFYRLLAETQLSNKELLGLLEEVSQMTLSQDENNWYRKTISAFQAKFRASLHQAITRASLSEAFALEDAIHPLTVPSVLRVLKELDIDKLERSAKKSVCLMMRALAHTTAPDSQKLFQAMNDVSEAILGDPSPECLQFAIGMIEKIAVHAQKGWQLTGPKMTDFERPVKNEFTDRLKKTPDLRVLERSEKAIAKFEKPFDAAMSYIDLFMALSGSPAAVGCFLSAALALGKAQQETQLQNENYAYRRAIVELVVTAYTIGHRNLCPATQLYALKSGIAILTAAFKASKSIDSDEQLLLEGFQEEVDRLAKVAPMVMDRMVQVYDLIYVDLLNREVMTTYLDKMRRLPENKNNPIYQYYLFEGTWKGWIDEEKFTFEEERKRTMKKLLKAEGQTFADVEALMNWPMAPRNSEGWVQEKPTPLDFSDVKFSHVEGIRFNHETGDMELLLTGSDDPAEALFDMRDVKEVLQLGIMGAQFTLDPPDSSLPDHPFQAALYAPSSLYGTNFLGTLLHTDLLLKMLSMGTEVNSVAPFAIRDAEESLLKRLPLELHGKFKALHEDLPETAGKIHRFWIEAGDLPYYCTQNKGELTYTFGACQMSVKKHLMVLDHTGKLVDTDKDEENNSREAKFAKLMTEEYDNLGKSFPELARLRELVKLQALSKIAQGTYTNANEQYKTLRIDKAVAEEQLDHIWAQISYPRVNSVSTLVNECLKDNGLARYQVSFEQLRDLEKNIYNQCLTADNQTEQQITTLLENSFHATLLSNKVFTWLNNGNKDDLASTLATSLETHEKAKLLRLCNAITNAGISPKPIGDSLSTECLWVPAIFRSNDSHRVYGGVNMNSNLVNGNAGGTGGRAPVTQATARYVVRMDAGGKIYGTSTCVDRVTGNTYTALELQSSIRDVWNRNQPNTRYFSKTGVGYTDTEHYTHHVKSGCSHVHDVSGRSTKCIDPYGNTTTYNPQERDHRCNK